MSATRIRIGTPVSLPHPRGGWTGGIVVSIDTLRSPCAATRAFVRAYGPRVTLDNGTSGARSQAVVRGLDVERAAVFAFLSRRPGMVWTTAEVMRECKLTCSSALLWLECRDYGIKHGNGWSFEG